MVELRKRLRSSVGGGTGEHGDRPPEAARGKDADCRHRPGLLRVLGRNDDGPEPRPFRRERHGEHAVHVDDEPA